MTREDAGLVVAYLNAAFPRDVLERESMAVLATEIASLSDYERAMRAARSLARGLAHLPGIAEFREAYLRESFAPQERPALEAGPQEPDPELAAEIRSFVDKLAARVSRDGRPFSFFPAEPGSCGDCGHEGERVIAGSLFLCEGCASARARIRVGLEREAAG